MTKFFPANFLNVWILKIKSVPSPTQSSASSPVNVEDWELKTWRKTWEITGVPDKSLIDLSELFSCTQSWLHRTHQSNAHIHYFLCKPTHLRHRDAKICHCPNFPAKSSGCITFTSWFGTLQLLYLDYFIKLCNATVPACAPLDVLEDCFRSVQESRRLDVVGLVSSEMCFGPKSFGDL